MNSETSDKSESRSDQDGCCRRRANSALRVFQNTLQRDDTEITDKLFTCTRCEHILLENLKRNDGIGSSQGGDMKQFRELLIDGTTAGILVACHHMSGRLSLFQNTHSSIKR